MTPLGYQQITDLSSATALTVPAGTQKAIIVAETQDVRWRDDGTSPSGTVGMVLTKNVPTTFDVRVNKLKFIETAASAKLNISYYG